MSPSSFMTCVYWRQSAEASPALKFLGAAASASRSRPPGIRRVRRGLEHFHERDLGSEGPEDVEGPIRGAVVYDDPTRGSHLLRRDRPDYALDVPSLVPDRGDNQYPRLHKRS